VAAAVVAFPSGTVTRLSFPARPDAPLVVRLRTPEERHPNGLNNVSMDPVRGKVLSVTTAAGVRAGQHLINGRYHMHLGLWGGMLSRILQSLVGASLPFFYFSGLWLWWSRRKRRLRADRHG